MGVVPPESKVKRNVRRWVQVSMPGSWHYAPPGGPFGRAGVPDDVWLWRGVFFAIESKADHRNEVTDLQRHVLQKIKKAGGIVAVLYGFEIDKLQRIREMIVERTKEWTDVGDSSSVRGVPLPDQSREEGDGSPEGDV
jgi:hypothetical protein